MCLTSWPSSGMMNQGGTHCQVSDAGLPKLLSPGVPFSGMGTRVALRRPRSLTPRDDLRHGHRCLGPDSQFGACDSRKSNDWSPSMQLCFRGVCRYPSFADFPPPPLLRHPRNRVGNMEAHVQKDGSRRCGQRKGGWFQDAGGLGGGKAWVALGGLPETRFSY